MNGMTGGARRRSTHLRRQIAGRLPVLLAVLVLAGCSVVERTASHRLRDEIARIRVAGEPLTFEELRAGQSAGDGADAAADYRAAAALLADLDSGPLFGLVKAYRAGTKSCPPAPPSTEVRERARLMLAQAEPALELIDRAARSEAAGLVAIAKLDGLVAVAILGAKLQHVAGAGLDDRSAKLALTARSWYA